MKVRHVKVTINGQSKLGTLFEVNTVVVEGKIKNIGMVEFDDGSIEGVRVNFIKMLYPNKVIEQK